MKKVPLTIALGLLTSLTMSGCFAGGTQPGGADGESRVRLAMLQPPRSGLSPLSDDAFKLSRWSTAETLVRLDSDGLPRPSLATAWRQRDAQTWEFTVRPGVSFHDGTPLTAQDAAHSLTVAASASPLPRILKGVDLKAVAEGDQVVVTTAMPDPLLPNRLSSPQLAILSPGAYEGGRVNPVGTGTGAFRLVEVQGTAGATLERNDRYWGGRAKASGIDVAFVPDGTARAAALRTGTADIVEAVPAGQTGNLDASHLHEVLMPRTNALNLNTAKGAFTDPALRALAREAIDEADLVSTIYEGRADAGAGLLGPAVPWMADARTRVGAAQALAQRPAPAAHGVPITLATYSDRAELPEVAVRVQAMLEAKGFDVTLEVREYQYIEADALAGAFDGFIASRAMLLDSGDAVATLVSDYSCQGGYNLSHLCDPEVDRLLDAAVPVAPGPQRQDAVAAAEARILALDPVVPLVHERVVQGEGAGVRGALRDPRERELVGLDTHVER